MKAKLRGAERGSALMLVPAGILILVALAAIAIDSSVAYMAQRELINRASVAASDAVTVGISPDDLQRGLDARPDPARVDSLVRDRLVGVTVAGYTVTNSDVSTSVVDDQVTVAVVAQVPYIFAPAVPGAREHAQITANGSAELRFSD